MIHLEVDPPAVPSREAGAPRLHRVAGILVATSRPLAGLASLRVPAPAPALPPAPEVAPDAPGRGARPVYRGGGWLGGRVRRVACVAGAGGYLLDVAQVGRFSVSRDGRRGAVDAVAAGASPAHLEEALLGPVLVLALALHGVWCLHASAVAGVAPDGGASRAGAVAFVGLSGAGKSTLAARLATGAGHRVRLADDVLPWLSAGERIAALPRFPQLKLPPGDRPGPGTPETAPLAALYLLERPEVGAEGGRSLRIDRVPRRDAVLALVRHTVAARLFDRELLARHLEACTEAARRLRVGRLSYPWTGDLPDGLAEALAGDLEAA